MGMEPSPPAQAPKLKRLKSGVRRRKSLKRCVVVAEEAPEVKAEVKKNALSALATLDAEDDHQL